MKNFSTCLWFDQKAEEAFAFYQTVFKNVKKLRSAKNDERSAAHTGLPKGSLLFVQFEIEGQQFLGLNGGPIFKPNPSISLFVSCEKAAEVDELFNKLSEGGTTFMPLDTYPFSERFGWVSDKFGVSWQVTVGDSSHKIKPFLMFHSDNAGRAEGAMKFYTSTFKNSKIVAAEKFAEGQGPAGTIKFGVFELDGQQFMAFDSPAPHAFDFNEGVSLIAYCDTQEEIDRLWEKLTADGGQPSQCGWLVDKFGVSWQVVPAILNELLDDKDQERAEKVLNAVHHMIKLDINALKEAYGKPVAVR